MKILARYILKEILGYFAISLLIFTGILFTLRVLKLTSLIVNKGVLLSQVATVFVSVIPAFLEIAVPLAALLGPMLAFARLSGDSEIIVIRASGISLSQLIRPIIIFGVFAAAIGLCVSHSLKPWGFQTLSETLLEIAQTKSTAGLEPGVFNDLGGITLYAEEINQHSGLLKKILIDDRRKEGEERVIVAREGNIESVAETHNIIFHLREGEIHEENAGKYILTRYVTNNLTVDAQKLQKDPSSQASQKTRNLSWVELQTEQNRLQDILTNPELLKKAASPQEQDVEIHVPPSLPPSPTAEQLKSTQKELTDRLRKVNFEMQSRFSLPIAALLLALVGMPLGIQSPRSQRTWGAGLSALIGLLVFLIYFAMFVMGRTFAEAGTVPTFIAAWTPNLITLLFALYLLRQMSTERWQTISEGVEKLLHSLKNLVAIRSKDKELIEV